MATERKSDCRIEFENSFPESKRTPENWHIWKRAWNAAIRTATNDLNILVIH